MSNKNSGFLFELIQSLEKQEKRYIRLFITKNTLNNNSNYLKVFDALSSITTYSKEIEKKTIAEKKIKNYSITKHLLYENILKALRNYHSENSIDAQLADRLLQINLLFEKRLYKQSLILTEKTLDLCLKLGKHGHSIELLDKQLKTYATMQDVKTLKKINGPYREKKRMLMEEQQQIFDLDKVANDIYCDLKTKWRGDKIRSMPLTTINKIKESELRSLTAKLKFYNIKTSYFFSIEDHENAFTYLARSAKLFETNSQLINLNVNDYIALLHNMNLIYHEQEQFDKMLVNIEKLEGLKLRSSEKRNRVLERVLSGKMNAYMGMGDFEKTQLVVKEIEPLLTVNKFSDVYSILFRLDISIFYFLKGEYSKSLKNLNDILQDRRIDLRKDIQKFVRVFNLIVHYEMGNYDYFDSLLRKSSYFFQHFDKKDAFQKTMLAVFNKLVITTSDSEKKGIFSSLVKQLKALEQDRELKEIYFMKFDYIKWARSKT